MDTAHLALLGRILSGANTQAAGDIDALKELINELEEFQVEELLRLAARLVGGSDLNTVVAALMGRAGAPHS